MKREFTEKVFIEYLDQTNEKGIERDYNWYKDGKNYQKKSYTDFHMEYNDWINSYEIENGYNSTGCYN